MARLSIVIGLEKVAVTEEKRVCLGVEVGRLKRKINKKQQVILGNFTITSTVIDD